MGTTGQKDDDDWHDTIVETALAANIDATCKHLSALNLMSAGPASAPSLSTQVRTTSRHLVKASIRTRTPHSRKAVSQAQGRAAAAPPLVTASAQARVACAGVPVTQNPARVGGAKKGKGSICA